MNVEAWQESIVIPTYKIGRPYKNPMFLEKRVYQGSSGVVYPHPVIDQVYDEIENKIYNAIFLENEFLKVMVLPELGGRIHMAYDKTNDYHFVYYNKVIKPALVGLVGPWISGGIEFNWPQHHRPSTFDPLDFYIESNKDGSKTVWVSEIEKMFHTKGMAGFTLYKDKAYIEVTGKLYNRTPLPQTFLWWANPAVSVDEHYQSVFPPDVKAVYDHGKRDVSLFPIAKGTYYKMNYFPGTDISWYKNIPVPTSFMAVGSSFDFVGGYHHKKKSGILHVANHHISPGKKQWTWGYDNFGQVWNKHLTDCGGPYIEIMTGVYTDNQPDFSWIMPNQEIVFKQYFMPYKEIGYVKNATKEALINVEFFNKEAIIKLYTTAIYREIKVELKYKNDIIFSYTIDHISPKKHFEKKASLPANCSEHELEVIVSDSEANILVNYNVLKFEIEESAPSPATAIKAPKDIKTNEELYMSGVHLEQYRHATYIPVHYYEEALRRDETDVRNNNALGMWYFRRGQFLISEKYFQKAVDKIFNHNTNPYDGEPLYNLGLSLLYQNKIDKAYTIFYKASWNKSLQDNAYFQLARIDASKKKWQEALDLTNKSLLSNTEGFKVRHLKVILLRKMKMPAEAVAYALETLLLDAFDFGTIFELSLIQKQSKILNSENWENILITRLRDNSHSYIDVAIDYASCGQYSDAVDFLSLCTKGINDPIYDYYLAYYYSLLDNSSQTKKFLDLGFCQNSDCVFPNRLEDITVLQFVIKNNPKDYKAPYYLGNLWYDKRQYSEAISCWELSVSISNNFPSVHRNLGIAYYNFSKDSQKALTHMEKSFELDGLDSRLLFELDQLYKKNNYKISYRLDFLEKHLDLIQSRDDLYLEYVTLKNLSGQIEESLNLLNKRNFHPWEGGEGKVISQYLYSKKLLAIRAIKANNLDCAIQLLRESMVYPENLGEGKLYGVKENDINYLLGLAFLMKGDSEMSKSYFLKSTSGHIEPTVAVFYNDSQPDYIFYQGLAYRSLNNEVEAENKFRSLLKYGKDHIYDNTRIDYFAVSLPDLMIFDEDHNKRHQIHCNYMMYLGYLGLKILDSSATHYNTVLEMENGHLGVRIIDELSGLL